MKLLSLSLFLLCSLLVKSQTVTIDNTGQVSIFSGLGSTNYSATESIYTDQEIGAANFTTAGTAIEKIGYRVAILGSNTTFSNVNIYMKNVPASSTTFTSGTYSTAGYTLVFSGNITMPSLGYHFITLTTPFVRNTGENLQVLTERTDNVSHASFSFQTSNGSNTNQSALSSRRYFGSVALSGTTVLSTSAFRSAITLIHEYTNDIGIQELYTLARLPIPNSTPHTVSCLVKNWGNTTATNLNVTLNVSGANSFTNTQTIVSLPPNASQLVNFLSYTPVNTGTDLIAVTLPADDYTINDSTSRLQIVNVNTWSYATTDSPFGGIGSTVNRIDFAAKFTTNANTFISQMRLHFSNTAGRRYLPAFWQANGIGGAPGTLIWESPDTLVSTLGYNNIVIPAPVAINTGDFYAGVRQVDPGINLFLSYQREVPTRPDIFYYYNFTASKWVDVDTTPTTPLRLMIEPKHILAVNAATTNISGAAAAANCSKIIGVTIANAGSNPIAAGAATVSLKVAGANTYTSSIANTGIINTGGSELINFTVPVPNAGTNLDTAFVSLAGDGDQLNDTIASSFTSVITAALNVVANNTISLVKNCEDNGWTYYSDPANYNTSLFAVQWDPTSTGQNSAAKANAIPTLQLDGTYFSAEDIPAKKATYTMRRYWNVDLAGNPLTGPVNVRFFYDPTEKTAIENAASTFATTHTGTIEPFSWFQLNAPSFVGDAAHVTPDFVLNSYPVFNSNGANNTINSVLYAQFDGLTKLVGGTYATGVGPSTALPLNLLSFEAKQAGRQHVLSWKTANEVNINKFIIERSSDGNNFSSIGEVNATGLNAYSFTDGAVLKGNNYYRLKIEELNGSFKLSEVRLIHYNTTGISLFPNPVKDNAVLELDVVIAGKINITLLDITGKAMRQYKTQIQPGINRIPVNMNGLARGSYILKVQGTGFVEMIRAVKL